MFCLKGDAMEKYYLTYLHKLSESTSEEELQKNVQYAKNRRHTACYTYEEFMQMRTPSNGRSWTNKFSNLLVAGKLDVTNKEYEKVRIPKRTKGYRQLLIPNAKLMQAQKLLLKAWDKYNLLPANAAHGFTKHRSTKTALEVHQQAGARWFLKVDIENFFPSCKGAMLYEAIRHNVFFKDLSIAGIWRIVDLCLHHDALPQGAPTSPMLSNLIMVEYDYAITSYCSKHNLTYTRYADDILISSPVSFNYGEVIKELRKMLKPFKINSKKTRYGSYNGRNWNLGLMYNNKMQITVGHVSKRQMKCRVHNWITKPELRTPKEYKSLLGLLQYYSCIEPGRFEEALTSVKENPPCTNPDNT